MDTEYRGSEGGRQGHASGGSLGIADGAPIIEPAIIDVAGPDPLGGDLADEAYEPDDLYEPSGRAASPPLRRLLVVVDTLTIALGWAAALLTAYATGDLEGGPLTVVAQTGLILGAGALLLSASGLYRRRICAVRSAEIARIGRVSLALAAATVVVLATAGRSEALFAGVVGGLTWFTALTVQRGVFREWIQGRRATGDFGAPVVVVGGKATSTLGTAEFLSENPVLGFDVRGVLCPPDAEARSASIPWLGRQDGLLEPIRRSRASGVVLDAASLTGDELNAAVQQLSSTDLHVHIHSGLRGVDRRRITVSPMADETFLHVAPIGLTRRQLTVKRAVDIVVAAAALVVFSPVLLVSALMVWAYDRGPIFFRQERVGQDGERFTLYKLRTMVVDAEARKAALQTDNGRNGPLFKLARDPRVTPFGRFLRSSSIDEIPQLLNVLEGTMSVVGPRPALPDEVAQFDERLNARLTVKPGVTGLWQVEARDLPSFDLYRRYDLLYVQNWSIGLDLTIIFRTAAVVGLRGLRAVLPSRFRDANAALE